MRSRGRNGGWFAGSRRHPLHNNFFAHYRDYARFCPKKKEKILTGGIT